MVMLETCAEFMEHSWWHKTRAQSAQAPMQEWQHPVRIRQTEQVRPIDGLAQRLCKPFVGCMILVGSGTAKEQLCLGTV